MDGYGISTYGDRIAHVFDEWPLVPRDGDLACEAVAELAAGGRVLELGVGTGRIALPLARRGVDVHGVDASAGMIERLRAKRGGAGIPVTMGNFADAGPDGPFTVVFAAYSTFLLLHTQEAQVRCFRNVAARLAPGGAFAIEAIVPDFELLRDLERARTLRSGPGWLLALYSRLDPSRQLVESTYVWTRDGRSERFPLCYRWVPLPELDLMARLAALRLRDRWDDWSRAPFTGGGARHVSVYEKPR